MINAVQTALHYRPHRLHVVRVRRAALVLARTVIDGFVLIEQAIKILKQHMLIGVNLWELYT